MARINRGGADRPKTVGPPTPDAIDAMAQRSDDLQRSGGVNARRITGIAITAGTDSVVNHGLGSSEVYWRIVDMRSASGSMVWRVTSDDRTLTLAASANCTIAIEVFGG